MDWGAIYKRQRPKFKNLTVQRFGAVKDRQSEALQDLVRHHVDSFNFLIDEGLQYAVQDLRTEELLDSHNRKIQLSVEDAFLGYPTLPETNIHAKSVKIYPSECREKGTTYQAPLSCTFQFMMDGCVLGSVSRVVGMVPVMVKSKRCRLYGLSPKELVQHHEEAEEFGGYFIINGNERIIRMLAMPRRNYPMAIVRNTWVGKGPLFTEYGVTIRCVRKDQTQGNMTLHYLSDGGIVLAFARNKELFYVPVVFILKALVDTTDAYIYQEVMRGNEEDMFLKGCVTYILRSAQDQGVLTRLDALSYIGQRFKLKIEMPPWTSDEAVTLQLLKEHVCVHLAKGYDKFNLIIFMMRKLYALSAGKCASESPDSPMNQEVLLGGHLYLMYLKDKLGEVMRHLKYELKKRLDTNPDKCDLTSSSFLAKIVETQTAKKSQSNSLFGGAIQQFLATGSIYCRSNLNLQQTTGLTIVADKLNFLRYISHFRAVHRGAFFSQMRTTSVRKLLPEAWGFICPVHTPDGAPCGLLNHLAALCQVVTSNPSSSHLPRLLCSLGMQPLSFLSSLDTINSFVCVLLDGKVIGYITEEQLKGVAQKLRVMKALGKENVPPTLEIGVVPRKQNGQYPGLFLFTTPTRMVRPVVNLVTQTRELVGSFEQVYMNIAVTPEEIDKELTTHMEVHEGAMLSVVSSFTPFSDFNQSPRNMYQCQMGKQTIGIPGHAHAFRSDGKMYILQTPQSPVVRPYLYDYYGIDDYPLGTNAVVAVISYTGYDMEDAMILNKASFERGFAHACIHKTMIVDIAQKGKDNHTFYEFGVLTTDKKAFSQLDPDGLPPVGAKLEEGDPVFSCIDISSGKSYVEIYKSHELAYVIEVKLLGSESGDQPLQRAAIKLRVNRNPIIGDKFASRHGQKGICSQKWPTENMPFTESGMVPDIIFNPHGFPSRMTIGMMIESMAGKAAALDGVCHDATPFTFSEDNSAVDFFGQHLIKAGYNYHGNERMYSGVDGREFEVGIFFGVVYYQRLRHMVSDKFQVRTTGPIDILTHQPVKGRRRAGGVRFGEMERDSLLAHGSSFLLQDRLLNCSDRSYTHLCRGCGSLLSPMLDIPHSLDPSHICQPEWRCRVCRQGGKVEVVAVPYVFRYLVAELAAMNIRVKIDVS